MKFHYFNRAIPFLVSFVSAHGMLNENHYAVVRKPDNRLQTIRTDDYSTIDTRSSTALSKGTLWPLRGTIFRLFGLTPNLFTSAS